MRPAQAIVEVARQIVRVGENHPRPRLFRDVHHALQHAPNVGARAGKVVPHSVVESILPVAVEFLEQVDRGGIAVELRG
jgi:hypothetical protein